MRAALYDPTATPPTMRLVDVAERALGPKEVRVDVRAVSMNEFWLALDTRPFIPGCDFTGEVVEVGTEVTKVGVGDRVVATSKGGGLAERAVVAEAGITRFSSSTTFVDGAASLVGIIASFVVTELTDRLSVAPAEATVAVHHDGDGFGATIAGLLRLDGWTTIGLSDHPVSAEDQLLVGYEHAVQADVEPLHVGVLRTTDGRGVDGLVDHCGTLTLDDAWPLLRPGGCFVRCSPFRNPLPPASAAAPGRAAERGIERVEFDTLETFGRRFDEVESRGTRFLHALERGDIVLPTVELPFAEVAELPGLLRSRTVVGRVVVTR